MSSEEQFASRPDPTPNGAIKTAPVGLPPVAPPSGKLMLQLFLVPGLIVAFLVAAWLVGGWLFGVSYSKETFLKNLNDPNAEVRSRTAEQLAQVLLRDDALASDSDFAWRLALLLDKTRDSARAAEQSYADRVKTLSKEDADAERHKLEPDRNFVSYLSACLGGFMVPVGAPVLKDLAVQKQGIDPRALRCNGGRPSGRWPTSAKTSSAYDKLDGPQKDAVLDQLRDAVGRGRGRGSGGLPETAGRPEGCGPGQAGRAGRFATRRLAARRPRGAAEAGAGRGRRPRRRRRPHRVQPRPGRSLPARAVRVRHELLARRRRGQRPDAGRPGRAHSGRRRGRRQARRPLGGEERQPDRGGLEIPGLQIRFNAAVALARFGGQGARVDVLKDMLDENYLRENLVLRPRDSGPDRPNEEVIGQTLLSALKAVAELHKLRPDLDLSTLKPEVDALAASGNPDVRTEAEKTRLALK